MTCDEFLSRAAEGLHPGDARSPADRDPDAAAHVAECASCRAALDDAREGLSFLGVLAHADAATDLPPADARAAWREATTARPSAARRVVRTCARAAAVLLAATGAFALAGGRVEAAEGRVAFVLAPAWAAAPEPPPPADGPQHADVVARIDNVAQRLDTAAQQVHTVAERIDTAAQRIDEVLRAQAASERAHTTTAERVDAARRDLLRGLDDAVARLERRRDDDAQTFADAIVSLRREVAALRFVQMSMADATAGAPSLPDPR